MTHKNTSIRPETKGRADAQELSGLELRLLIEEDASHTDTNKDRSS